MILAAQAGDSAALRAIYEDNVATVFSFLRNRVGHHPAEDLTAETFCRAFEKIDTYEWRGVPIRAWLLRIAYNLVVAQARRAVVQQPIDAEVPGGGDDGEQILHLQMAEVRTVLRSLSDQHQAVIDLRFFQELSVDETGEVLDLTNEAVRALTYRALKGLRAHLCGSTPSSRTRS